MVHIQTGEQAIDDLLSLIRQLAEEKRVAGWVPPAANGNAISALKDVYVRRKINMTK